jgi:NAD+ synthase (glutamine-hydrolysing)
MKIALCQINTIIGNFKSNIQKIAAIQKQLRAQSYDLIVFPELVLTGYPPRDLLERPSFIDQAQQALMAIARSSEGLATLLGTILPNPGSGNSLYNAAVIVKNGAILYVQKKSLLPNYDVFDEARYFEPASIVEKPFEYLGHKIGITICEDIWNHTDFFKPPKYHLNPIQPLMTSHVDMLINLSASPFHMAKLPIRQNILKITAQKVNAPVFYCNLVGGNDELIFDGCSMITNAQGEILQLAKDFQEGFLPYDTHTPAHKNIHPTSKTETESIFKALVLGIRDYTQKCGFTKALIGLSGGIDSSLVACLAVEALGPANVLGITLPSPFSSKGSILDSQQLSQALNIEFKVIPITPLYKKFLSIFSPHFSNSKPDITEENLQARIRGTILMSFSNKFNYLLLTTGNKSELSVGYCTLYGDMCGGLAVIADIPKTMVYQLATYANRNQAFIPTAVFTKPPSAELKLNQTDQDSLPPYELLDRVLKAYVEDNQTLSQIQNLNSTSISIPSILDKLDHAEYKRHQLPPGLKVTPKSFGIGRRFPIAHQFHESIEPL